MKNADNLVWLDLEMTGLDPQVHAIIEIGCAVTDSRLRLIKEGPALVIHQPPEVLDLMDAWCVEQHGKSGLTRQVQESRITLAEAEEKTLAFLREYCVEKASPLCGNSIWQDRRFLDKYMPKLNAFFHYRNVDVSSLKELVRRWYPPELQAPQKEKSHHVMEDIRESISELEHYRNNIFK